MRNLREPLQQRKQARLYRSRKVMEGPQGAQVVLDGRPCLAFCSNDYLGLSHHPSVIQALQAGAEKYGAGSGSAHLINGHSAAHHALEEELAEFVGRPRALLFSTGYMANLGVMSALLQKGDCVYQDRLNHASLLDAGLLSGARLQRYLHGDVRDLDKKMKAHRCEDSLIATDGVFSMDGDIAPLPQLAQVAQTHRSWLMVDDAHGIGVLGEHGGGSLEHFHLGLDEVPVLMGTLGKALGSFGAFVAGSDDLIETMIQKARSYIYTTAPPAAVAEATRASLRLVREEDWRREKLRQLIRQFRQGAQQLGLHLMESRTPVQPLLVHDSARAVDLSQALWEQGIYVPAIRPPTVPEGMARLRISFSADHETGHVEKLLDVLDVLLRGQQ